MAQTDSSQTLNVIKPFVTSESILKEVQMLVDFSVSIDQVYPATALQTGMISLTLQDRSAYFNQVVFKSIESVDIKALQDALVKVIQNHEILRTTFVQTTAGIYQAITEQNVYEMDTTTDLKSYCIENRARGFTADDQFWFRVCFVQEEEGQFIVIAMHHTLYDGWCSGFVLRDLVRVYQGFKLERSPAFKEVIDYQESQDKEAVQKYWVEYLKDAEFDVRLPKMVSLDEKDDSKVQKFFFRNEIELVSRKYQITVSTLMKAAWALTLKIFTQKDEIVFGNVVSGRDIPIANVEKIIGSMINTIPCVVSVKNLDTKIKDLVQSLQNDYICGIPFSHAGLSDIQKWNGVGNQKKLFRTNLVYENLPLKETSVAQLFERFDTGNNVSGEFNSFDVTVLIFPEEKEIAAEFKYDHSVLNRTAVQKVSEYFGQYLTAIVQSLLSNQGQDSIKKICVIPQSEYQQILDFGKGPVQKVPYVRAHDAFEECARINPDCVAVEHEGSEITYGELNRRADCLAAGLIARGVQV
ncbi:hypothetical protein HDV01_004518, partial [Terramyces sp. JEL0728]